MMRRFLMTGMAAVALGGLFSSCSKEMESVEGTNSVVQDIVANYETAFITRFGQPAENQTWGFGPITTGTRAVVGTPSIAAEGYYSYNAEMALAWKGVEEAIASRTAETQFSFMNAYSPWRNSGWEDKFYQINASVVDSELSDADREMLKNAILNKIPENGNNLGKAQSTGYSITTKGGPVTITPVYHQSSSNDKISYYYYDASKPKPSVEDIKKMDKYVIGEMGNGLNDVKKQTFSLVYKDKDGNVSYSFPPNYIINFIVNNTDNNGTRDIYKSGGITTMTGGSSGTLESKEKYAMAANDYKKCGDVIYKTYFQLRFGNGFTPLPKFKPLQRTTAFSTEKGTTFEYYTPGNDVNGGLDGGSTAYYFKPDNTGKITVGVSLGGNNKTLKVVHMSNNDISQATTGTEILSYKNENSTSYNGTFSFDVEGGNLYAIYAEGSKLGFFGFEFSNGSTTESEALNGDLANMFSRGFDFGFSTKLGSTMFYMGKTPAYFSAAKTDGSLQSEGYTSLTSGAAREGGLIPGATTYYINAYQTGFMRVAVALNSGKTICVQDLGNQWNSADATEGTLLEGYPKSVTSQYKGTYNFPVEGGHWYAVYSSDSRLGFYGCEFLQGTPATEGTPSMSLIEKKTIANQPEFYSDGDLNVAIHADGTWGLPDFFGYGITEPKTSHTAVYAIDDVEGYTNLVGFEDWKDFDFNDVVFAVKGTTGGEEIEVPEPEEEEEKDPDPICRIIAEDLTTTEKGDFDFNDVVFDVCPDAATGKTTLIIRCVGGELPLYIGLASDPLDDAHEVHKVCGLGATSMTNTGWDNGGKIVYDKVCGRIVLNGTINTRSEARNIVITVVKKKETIKLTADIGRVPSKICVGTDYKWCRERVDIDEMYHTGNNDKLFKEYVSGSLANDDSWYKKVDLSVN
jgi:hypothetical protein